MIDSHCHLNFKAFDNDWQKVAKRAFNSGVEAIINVGSNLATSYKAMDMARDYPLLSKEGSGEVQRIFAAIGLHPIHVSDEELDIGKYERMITDCHCEKSAAVISRGDEAISPTFNVKPSTLNSIIAIGEIGLDLYHRPDNLSRQTDNFIQFIDLANQNHLPVIIHNRLAGKETLEILINHKPLYGGVMHFFSEDYEYAKKLFAMGIKISFTGAITYNFPLLQGRIQRGSGDERSQRKLIIDRKTIEVIKKSPLKNILVETDAPYVVPELMRSRGITRNEPIYVVEVAKTIADLRGIDLDGIDKTTTQNTKKLFKLSL